MAILEAAVATLILMIVFLGFIYCSTIINERFNREDD